MSNKNRLGTPMTQMSNVPTDTTSSADAPSMYTGPKGRVDQIAEDIVAGPQQGPRRSATGERESELSKKQNW
ncbi:MAG TPA: hypothetical protein VN976_21920 [Verrucomicrobiae bacterium]|nr:hypothetical protein [Verrucomicrobiae bacterium]